MKQIVIVGGGFTGSYCARKLEKYFDVTLIDNKNYFEFTPGILRTIVEPKHAMKIQSLHRRYLKSTKVVNANVGDICKEEITLDDGKKIRYDYLIIATGSRYNSPFKEAKIVIASRGRTLVGYYERLCKSNEVLIIGGGIVGIELAAEIAEHYDDKKITIVHSRNKLMQRQNKKTSDYAEKILRKKKVNIILGERVIDFKDHEFRTNKGTKLSADMTFLCTGISPNYEMIKKCMPELLDDENFVKVNRNMQVIGHSNIFVGGDIAGTKEEKTAQNAENHAKIIVGNICRMEYRKKLKNYEKKDRVMLISLGKNLGIMTYKNFALTGIIPGWLKSFVEFKTMLNLRK